MNYDMAAATTPHRSSAGTKRPRGRSARQSGNPGRSDAIGRQTLPARISVGHARYRTAQIAVAADPARDHPEHSAQEIRPCLQPGVDAGGIAVGRDHEGAGCETARAAGGRRAGGLGHAVRQSGDGRSVDSADGCRVRSHPARAHVSAIFRSDHGHGDGPAGRCAAAKALATRDADRAALSRRCDLYRCARPRSGCGRSMRWPSIPKCCC